MNIYLVKSYDPCECENTCYCQTAGVDAVFFDEDTANEYAKTGYKQFVDEIYVHDGENFVLTRKGEKK